MIHRLFTVYMVTSLIPPGQADTDGTFTTRLEDSDHAVIFIPKGKTVATQGHTNLITTFEINSTKMLVQAAINAATVHHNYTSTINRDMKPYVERLRAVNEELNNLAGIGARIDDMEEGSKRTKRQIEFIPIIGTIWSGVNSFLIYKQSKEIDSIKDAQNALIISVDSNSKMIAQNQRQIIAIADNLKRFADFWQTYTPNYASSKRSKWPRSGPRYRQEQSRWPCRQS
jgi:hypothetical protein